MPWEYGTILECNPSETEKGFKGKIKPALAGSQDLKFPRCPYNLKKGDRVRFQRISLSGGLSSAKNVEPLDP